jgi:hypothetical protein
MDFTHEHFKISGLIAKEPKLLSMSTKDEYSEYLQKKREEFQKCLDNWEQTSKTFDSPIDGQSGDTQSPAIAPYDGGTITTTGSSLVDINQQPQDLNGYWGYDGTTASSKKFTRRPSFSVIQTPNLSSIDMEQFLRLMTPQKSQFEELINALFTLEEKYDFLISMGYTCEVLEGKPVLNNDLMMRVPRKDMHQEQVLYSSLEYCFLREITIKFKNLLLAKQTLKLKI